MAYEHKLPEIAKDMLNDGPGVYMIKILHDDDCPKLQGGECVCDPEIRRTKILKKGKK